MKKRIISVLLVAAMVFGLLPMFAVEADAAEGRNYTASAALASVLDSVFAGDIDVYSDITCTNEVMMPIDQRMSNSTIYYVKNKTTNGVISGYQCYIYANAVYNKLFNETVTHGNSFTHSEIVIPGGSNTVSYDMFEAAGVRCGAYMRTTTRSNGQYDSKNGHSLIILSYDSSGITFLEGNGDGNGLVRVITRTWDNFNNLLLKGKGRYISHVVQPKDDYYDSLYPENGNYLNKCDYYRSHCKVQVTSGTTYIKSLPCSQETDPDSTNLEVASKGDEYTALAMYKNTAGNLWYKVKTGSGETGYLYSGDTKFISQVTDDVTVTGVSAPTQLQKGDSYSIKGIISARYQRLSAVGATVTNTSNATVTGTVLNVDVTSYNLYNSAVDYAVKFNELSAGEYTYQIVATAKSYYAYSSTEEKETTSSIVLYTSTFSVVADASCKHNYTSAVTAPTCTEGGYTTYTCQSCGYTYNDNYTDAAGHSYGSWTTTVAATCTADGVQARSCSACDDVQTQGVPAAGHSYTSEVIAATCTSYEMVRYTCTRCGDTYTAYTGVYSDWSTAKPEGIDDSLIESRTEYSYQTKEYTTGTSDTMDGWTLYNTTTEWGEYGDWSEWSDTAVTASDTTKVETRKVYAYYYYKCSACGAHMHGWGITCPTWAGGCGKATIKSSDYVKVWSTVSYDSAGLKDFYGTGKYYAIIDGERVFQHSDGEKTQYRYCTRELVNVYHFYRWSDWSDWSADAVYADENTNVETRTVYRYVMAELGAHEYTGSVTAPTCTAQGYTTYTCGVCGSSYQDNYTAALGHSYSYQVANAPTTSAAGALTGVCASCGGTVSVTLPKLNTSDYQYAVIKEPAAGEPGIGRYTWNNTEYGVFYFDVEIEELPEDGPQLVVESKTAYRGNTVTVDVTLVNNPGFSVMNVGFVYDSTYLTLTSVENRVDSLVMTYGSAVVWDSAEDYTEDGVLCTLTFEIAEDAPAGEYVIDIIFMGAANSEFETVEFAEVSGTLQVAAFIYGDVNGDGQINAVDLAMLRKYLANKDPMTGESTIAVQPGADCNGDGQINAVDLAMLRKYLANKDPITGESSVVLGPKP